MTTLQQQIVNSFQVLWDQLALFIPSLVVALIVIILGWLVASVFSQIIKKALQAIHIDTLANRLGMDKLSQEVGRQLSFSSLGAWLVKWFVVVVAFVTAAEILGLAQVTKFLYEQVIPYFGNVIIAVLILLIGIVAANFLSEVVRGTVRASGLHTSNALSMVTRWAIIIFAVLAALVQLSVATAFLQTLFIGVIAMLAIAGGLAFGLGGRDHAKKVLDEIERNVTHNRD